MRYHQLSNGELIPFIGFGPATAGFSSNLFIKKTILGRVYRKFFLNSSANFNYVNSVSNAIRLGYRLIDYSASYGKGNLIGFAIKKSGVSRSEIVLTTRVSNKAQFGGTNSIKKEFFDQLKNMNTDYVDILMFHWPVTGYYENTWKVMVDLYREGYVKTLGVANCHVHHLKKLFSISKEKPLINQFEIHPLFTQKGLISFCKDNDILPEAYTPIARFDDRLIRLPSLISIANKYNKTVSQIILRWHIQNGVIPVVRCLSINHQKENIDIFNFELNEKEMALIDGININSRLRFDPDNCDFSIL